MTCLVLAPGAAMAQTVADQLDTCVTQLETCINELEARTKETADCRARLASLPQAQPPAVVLADDLQTSLQAEDPKVIAQILGSEKSRRTALRVAAAELLSQAGTSGSSQLAAAAVATWQTVSLSESGVRTQTAAAEALLAKLSGGQVAAVDIRLQQLQLAVERAALELELYRRRDELAGGPLKVVALDPTYGFVVINAGLQAALSEGLPLCVVRQGALIAQAKISSITDLATVADLLPGGGAVEVGDQVHRCGSQSSR